MTLSTVADSSHRPSKRTHRWDCVSDSIIMVRDIIAYFYSTSWTTIFCLGIQQERKDKVIGETNEISDSSHPIYARV